MSNLMVVGKVSHYCKNSTLYSGLQKAVGIIFTGEISCAHFLSFLVMSIVQYCQLI